MPAGPDVGRGAGAGEAPGPITLRHRGEHLLFRLFAGAARRLPERTALAVGAMAGRLAGVVLRIRRRAVDRHLAWAFPGRPRRWRRRVARACYRHLGREGIAALRLAELDGEAIRERTEIRGLEALRGALEEGRGAVIVTGHLGNWEVGGAGLAARGVPLDAVAVRQGNPLFQRALEEIRAGLGVRLIPKRHARQRALRALRRGRAVALLGDQNPISGGIEVEFFGRPASTARGPAVLALRTGAPLLLGTAIRRPGPRARYAISLEPVPFERTGETRGDVRRLVQAYTRGLEEAVRRDPEQYFWHHERWKERNRPS